MGDGTSGLDEARSLIELVHGIGPEASAVHERSPCGRGGVEAGAEDERKVRGARQRQLT